jgi:uncharacterized protein
VSAAVLDDPSRRLLALVAILAATVAGCGGGDDEPRAARSQLQHGGELFAQRCGGCHTLTAAGTQGSPTDANRREPSDGPSLDRRRITEDDALFAIRNGGFGNGTRMPANVVTGDDAKAVAHFVARYAGSKAAESPGANIDNPSVRRMQASPAGAEPVTAPSSPTDPAFLRAAFDSAQALWRQKFEDVGARYDPARLVLFHTLIHTRCGTQPAHTGPFYCPPDHTVYLNTDFFDALAHRYRLASPFPAGYVAAHEVAHHVQQLLGVHARVAVADAREPAGANGRSVQVELQADCYAGVWLHSVARAGELSQGDVADILTAAAVVGDDYQRNRAGAELAPETWTHGSSAQRVHWVGVGKAGGLPAECDSFSGE